VQWNTSIVAAGERKGRKERKDARSCDGERATGCAGRCRARINQLFAEVFGLAGL
jgi:hypothetical protein